MPPRFLSLVVFLSFLSTFMPSIGYAQMIVGHRGASFDAPENTLAAFQEAWAQGADGVEGDFYFTQDKQIVCIHDKDTLRTGGKKLVVSASTLSDLQTLEYGSWKDKKFAGEPLPLFRQVLHSIPEGKTFVIELKTGPEIVQLLKTELDAHPIDPKQLLIIAFNEATAAESKRLLPNIRVHWLTSFKETAGEWHPNAREVIATVQRCQADGVGFQGNRAMLNAEFIQEIRGGGVREFHVWTIDVPEDAKYFQSLGAIGITTNRPKMIRESLQGIAN